MKVFRASFVAMISAVVLTGQFAEASPTPNSLIQLAMDGQVAGCEIRSYEKPATTWFQLYSRGVFKGNFHTPEDEIQQDHTSLEFMEKAIRANIDAGECSLKPGRMETLHSTQSLIELTKKGLVQNCEIWRIDIPVQTYLRFFVRGEFKGEFHSPDNRVLTGYDTSIHLERAIRANIDTGNCSVDPNLLRNLELQKPAQKEKTVEVESSLVGSTLSEDELFELPLVSLALRGEIKGCTIGYKYPKHVLTIEKHHLSRGPFRVDATDQTMECLEATLGREIAWGNCQGLPKDEATKFFRALRKKKSKACYVIRDTYLDIATLFVDSKKIATYMTDFNGELVLATASLNYPSCRDLYENVVGFPFELEKLDQTLVSVSEMLYSQKGGFFRSVADHLKTTVGSDTLMARLFVLNAIEPLISGTSSQAVQEKIHPSYRKARTQANERYGIRSLSDFRATPGTVKTSFALLSAALRESKDFVSDGKDRKDLESLISTIGTLLARPVNDRQDVNSVAASLQNIRQTLDDITANRHTHELGQVAQSVAEYLSGI